MLAAIAGLVMGVAPLMQAVRCRRRRCADDVSPAWLAVIAGGTLVWALYGFSLDNWAVIVPNLVGCLASAATLAVVVSVRRTQAAALSHAGGTSHEVPRDAIGNHAGLHRPGLRRARPLHVHRAQRAEH